MWTGVEAGVAQLQDVAQLARHSSDLVRVPSKSQVVFFCRK